eukprot:PhF_6_TR5691/c0_g1_i1/m.8389/K15289/SLC35F5; solute carrier family 35, member F5
MEKLWPIFLLIVMAFCFVMEAESGQCLQEASCLGVNTPFRKPYLMTYINHSLLAFVLLIPSTSPKRKGYLPIGPTKPSTSLIPGWLLETLKVWKVAFWLNVCWFGGDYSWYVALPHTSVAEGTAFTDSVCVFTAIVSWLFLSESFSRRKAIAILCVVGGLISLLCADFGERGVSFQEILNHVNANLLAVNTAFCYAVYEVYYAVSTSSDEEGNGDEDHDQIWSTLLTCGRMSLCNIFLMPFGYYIVSQVVAPSSWCYETIAFPTRDQYLALFINSMCSSSFVVLMLICVKLTTPTQVAVACAMEIPLAAVVDLLWRGRVLDLGKFPGVLMIVCGFVLNSSL